MTVNDYDSLQYTTFNSKMIGKIDTIYAHDNSLVSYWKNGGKTNIGGALIFY